MAAQYQSPELRAYIDRLNERQRRAYDALTPEQRRHYAAAWFLIDADNAIGSAAMSLQLPRGKRKDLRPEYEKLAERLARQAKGLMEMAYEIHDRERNYPDLLAGEVE